MLLMSRAAFTSGPGRAAAHACGVHACSAKHRARTQTTLALTVSSVCLYNFIFAADGKILLQMLRGIFHQSVIRLADPYNFL